MVWIAKEKCNKRAIEYCKTADDKLKKIEHFAAIENYNKALCFAKSKKVLSLCYSKRASAYYKLNEYEECIQNIKWSRENGFLEEDEQQRNVLDEMEEFCQIKIDGAYKSNKEVLNDFFKLSYPANPKLPFMVDCIKFDKNSKRVFTARDLEPGDIISIEDPFAFSYLYFYLGCCVCMRVNKLNLIPSDENASQMFCSEECREELKHYKVTLLAPFPYVFPSLGYKTITTEDLRNLTTGNTNDWIIPSDSIKDFYSFEKTIFDIDFSDSASNFHNDLLECWYSLRHKVDPEFAAKSSSVDKITQFISHDEISPRGNGYVCTGFVIYLFLNTLNHACYSNVTNVIVNHQSVLYVTRPIKAGEEILFNFTKNLLSESDVLQIQPLNIRRNDLLKSRNAVCHCYYCINNTTDETLRKNTHPQIQQLLALQNSKLMHNINNIEEMLSYLKRYWKLMAESGGNPEFYDLANLMKQSNQLMKSIADLETFPCINLRSGFSESVSRIFLAIGHGVYSNSYVSCKVCSNACPHNRM